MNMYVTIRRRNGNPSPPKRKIPNRSCQGEREQQREGECPEIKCSQRGSLEQTRKTEREPSANLHRISGIAMGSRGSWLDLQRFATIRKLYHLLSRLGNDTEVPKGRITRHTAHLTVLHLNPLENVMRRRKCLNLRG